MGQINFKAVRSPRDILRLNRTDIVRLIPFQSERVVPGVYIGEMHLENAAKKELWCCIVFCILMVMTLLETELLENG